MPYSIIDHKHRFAAWAASRAASVNGCRFPVETGKKILDRLGLTGYIDNPNTLPDPTQIDEFHSQWRNNAITFAQEEGYLFTHGISAKIINVYFKSILVCGGHHNHASVMALHPPVDSLMLKGLAEHNVGNMGDKWKLYNSIGWSKFDSMTYEMAIRDLRRIVVPNEGLWGVERYWPGHQ